jgi:cyclic pyranopterin phosphate synthase
VRDSFGRDIRYLRVSVTDRCNLRCVYCMPAAGVRLLRHDQILSFERIAEVVRAAASLGFSKVRLTGGEPLARKGLASLVSMLAGIPGIGKLAMTTNGTLLAPVAAELKALGLDSVNVSLDTLDPVRYRALTRGGSVGAATEGIRAALDAGLSVKLNVVALEDSTQAEFDALRVYAAGIGADIQFIARYRLDEEKRDGGEYDRPPPCSRCDRLRLLADGTLRPCLHSGSGFPVDFSDVAGSIERAILAKPERGLACSDLAVGQIGG